MSELADAVAEADGEYCRLCALRAAPDRLRSFATAGADSDALLADVRCLRAAVRRADGLPQAACLDCLVPLEAAAVFLRRVTAAQLTLARIFQRVERAEVKKETEHSDSSSDVSINDRCSSPVRCTDDEDNVNLLSLNSIKYEINIKQEAFNKCVADDDTAERKSSRKPRAARKRTKPAESAGEGAPGVSWPEGSVLPLYGGVPTAARDEPAPAPSAEPGPRWSEHWCCRRCDHRAASLQRLREHSWRRHARCIVFKCLLCSVRMFTYKHFLQHVPRHLPGLRRCCELCDARFASPAAARLHRHLRHAADDTAHRCANCGAAFLGADELRAHRDAYTVVRASTAGGNVFRCSHCPKAFPNKIGLVGHMDCHDPSKNICKICNKRYKNKYILSQHEAFVHCNLVQFICQICGKGFKKKSDLKGHLDVHSGIKPFSCKICAKKFRTETQLKAHQICHTGENSFVCNICSKSYKYRSGLRDHLRAHNNDRPYSCDVCNNKSFISWSNYNKHMKAIHNKNMAKNNLIPG